MFVLIYRKAAFNFETQRQTREFAVRLREECLVATTAQLFCLDPSGLCKDNSPMSSGDIASCEYSIVIATRNRPEDLERCLFSVLASPRRDLEVLVADQSDTAETEDIVLACADPRVRYLHLDEPGKERAQNAAVSVARARAIAFTDDDCTVSPAWIDDLESALRRFPTAMVVYGAVEAANHDEHELFIPTFDPPSERLIRRALFPAHQCGIGANMAVRREAFEALGGFEIEMGPGSPYRSGGDWELAFRALRCRMHVLQSPQISLVHHGSRRYDDGSVRRLIFNNYYGIGAGYGLHARRFDPFAWYQLGAEFVRGLATSAVQLARRSRPIGIRRVLALLLGFINALARGRVSSGTKSMKAPS